MHQAFPLLFALLTLAGCSLAPAYERPDVAAPAAFKEATTDAQWKTAEPAEAPAENGGRCSVTRS
jgi:multidrug efflux system outer membrane protein